MLSRRRVKRRRQSINYALQLIIEKLVFYFYFRLTLGQITLFIWLKIT